MTQWETGVQLGPYHLLAPIGAGGMGEVWKARDARLDRIVAIKKLNAQHGARFEQEARAIAALNHPHICQIYDIGPDYLVLEYIEGTTLKGPVPAEEAVRLALEIAGALEAAHAKGITHRDLKPGNILVTAQGSAKLLDFGLAKLEKPAPSSDAFSTLTVGLTEPGVVVGTVAYMSPEQAQGQPVDVRSDIFSFGAVLYELLSGQRPFRGETVFATMTAVVQEEPPPLSVPGTLERIVRRCLAKQPSARYQTMTEVRIELDKAGVKAAEQGPSIAVLPFANMSRDPDDDYFSDGLAEEIINALARMPGLKVTSRTSAFAFRGKEQDITKIAEALRVRTVLEGSVRRSGNRIRVTAQLISAENGYHLWSERYDREMADVFALQDDIAAAIAKALQVMLSGKPVEPRRHVPALLAYDAYLKGRHLLENSPGVGRLAGNVAEVWARSKEYFDQAIRLDPDYAEPHIGLGSCYLRHAIEGVRAATEMMPLVRDEAKKALALDSSALEAHALLGSVAALYDYDWPEAERLWLLLDKRVDSPTAVRLGIYCLASRRRTLEMAELLERALQHDPLNVLFRGILGIMLNWAGMYDRALDEARKASEIDEEGGVVFFVAAENYALRGMFAEALSAAEKAHQTAPWHPRLKGILAGLLSRTGDQGRADDLIRQLTTTPGQHGVPMGMIMYHLLRGDEEGAIDWFEKGIEQREPIVVVYHGHPLTEAWRSNPRWAALMKKMNLPEAAL